MAWPLFIWELLALRKEKVPYLKLVRSRDQSTPAVASKAEVASNLVIFVSWASRLGTQERSQFVEGFAQQTTEMGLLVSSEGLGVGSVCVHLFNK